jgi:hypothetical protein
VTRLVTPLPLALSLFLHRLTQSFVTSRMDIVGSSLLGARPVISACPFCLWLALLSTPLTQSFVTSRLDIGESNLLVTSPVISACSFSLASSSLSLPFAICSALDPLLPGTPSDYLGALLLGGSAYGASVPATRLVTSACCLSSSFAFAISPFSSTCALS